MCLGVAEASIALMLIFLRRRIAVAIAVLREASKYGSRVRSQMYRILTKPPQVDFCCFCCCRCFRAIRHITSTLFYPLITFLMLTVCILYWAVTAVYPSVNTHTHTHSAALKPAFYQLVSISLTSVLKPAALHPQGNRSIKLCLLM